MHRLDKETSGLLLIAKKRSALTALQDQLRQRSGDKVIGKTYAALVDGRLAGEQEGHRRAAAQVPRPATGNAACVRSMPTTTTRKRSITLVKVARRFAGFTLLDVTIKTGRTHQIRVHLAHEGHPIVGDAKYGDFALNKAVARGPARFERMFLHAQRLRFAHPASGEVIELAGGAAVRMRGIPRHARPRMTRPRQFDLIVFDWDGTLFDSTALITRCIQAACADLGVPVPSDTQAQFRDRHGPGRGAAATPRPTCRASATPSWANATAITTSRASTRWCCSTARSTCWRRLKARGHRLGVATGKSRRGLDEALRSVAAQGHVRRHPHRRRDRVQAGSADAARADAASSASTPGAR